MSAIIPPLLPEFTNIITELLFGGQVIHPHRMLEFR